MLLLDHSGGHINTCSSLTYYLKGQREEHDKQHFPLCSAECLKVYKLDLSPCIVFYFLLITWEKAVSSLVSLHHHVVLTFNCKISLKLEN